MFEETSAVLAPNDWILKKTLRPEKGLLAALSTESLRMPVGGAYFI